MRFLASVPGVHYILAADGTVHALSTDTKQGHAVRDLDAEIMGLRRHAAFKLRQGDEQGADEWAIAADRLAELAGEPLAAA